MTRWVARVAKAFIHLCLDPWVGLTALIIVTVGTSMAAGLAITVVGGALLLALTLWLLDRFASFERARARLLLGLEVAEPRRPAPGRRFGFLGRQLGHTPSWWALAYAFVQPIVGTILSALNLAVWSSGLAAVGLPFYRSALPRGTAHLGLFDVTTTPAAFGVAGVGLLVLVAAPAVTLAAGAADAALVRGLLGRNREAELAAEVVEITARRSATLDAAEAERRRLERDLHDGAQQRLVSLGMTLGLARQKLATDPDQAEALLAEAHTEAKEAMAELRAIARGIHPAILDDRGLDAAVSALAARCPVPVTVTVDVARRLPQSIESAAYYVIAEALTNVAKHANAHHASVEVRFRDQQLIVTVSDNGQGGAVAPADGGLAGLADRLRALGGRLTIDSPPGGPTTLTAELPDEP